MQSLPHHVEVGWTASWWQAWGERGGRRLCLTEVSLMLLPLQLQSSDGANLRGSKKPWVGVELERVQWDAFRTKYCPEIVSK